jgi:hypothetical protein
MAVLYSYKRLVWSNLLYQDQRRNTGMKFGALFRIQDPPGPDHESHLENIRRFGAEVIPAFR